MKVSQKKQVAVATALDLLQSPQKINPKLKAQLCELILRLEAIEMEHRDAAKQRKHDLRLAELKASALNTPGPDDLKAIVNAVIDERIAKEKNGAK